MAGKKTTVAEVVMILMITTMNNNDKLMVMTVTVMVMVVMMSTTTMTMMVIMTMLYYSALQQSNTKSICRHCYWKPTTKVTSTTPKQHQHHGSRGRIPCATGSIHPTCSRRFIDLGSLSSHLAA